MERSKAEKARIMSFTKGTTYGALHYLFCGQSLFIFVDALDYRKGGSLKFSCYLVLCANDLQMQHWSAPILTYLSKMFSKAILLRHRHKDLKQAFKISCLSFISLLLDGTNRNCNSLAELQRLA